MSIGRNHPCHCGSGKKYKHCHEAQDKAAAAETRRWESARQTLSRDMIAFAREKRFAESFAQGIELFWNKHYTLESADQMSQDEALRFFDWFTFDYVPADRPRLLEVYAAEKGAMRNEHEQKILADWQTAGPSSAYLVTAIEDEQLHLQDLFDESSCTVTSESGAREGQVGQVLLAHLVTIRDQLCFSGASVCLPGETASEIQATLRSAFEAYRAEQPEASWSEFLRARSYLLNHLGLAQAEQAGRSPIHGGQKKVRKFLASIRPA
jgi:hypothetical protein